LKEFMGRFVCSYRRFYFCTDLESDARRFVMRHFVLVSEQSEELLELPVEELQAILGSDELNEKHEEVVWECMLRWIDHDAENRKGHIVELMKNVRLGLLDQQFFYEKVSILLKTWMFMCREAHKYKSVFRRVRN
jgi:kelch-like protein 10